MLSRYPQLAVLRDGRKILIRPFEEADSDALFAFFQRLPAQTRDFAWDRIDHRALVDSWAANIDYGKAFPLLAFSGSQIVADATLHRRQYGPLRLVGRIKWLIEPDYRGAGLGTLLVNHFIDTARHNGLRYLSCMLVSDLERDAIATLTELGFDSHTKEDYGSDPNGGTHDMTKMTLRL